jgi:protein phosphatase
MGTTITVALVEDGVVAIGHVGDSRGYLIRDQKVEQLTEDHSLVAELVRSGRLSPEEADTHPQRSVITRALGTDPDVDVDSFSVEAKSGDVFLICSDGLTSMIGDETILGIVNERRDNFDAVAKELIGAANESGGEDNITVVFFEMTDKAPEPVAETKTMPAVQAPPTGEADEDTLSGLESVPTVQTMVVPPEQVQAFTETDGAATGTVPHEPPKERFSVRAARLVVALAVVAALGLLVYWLLGQSR